MQTTVEEPAAIYVDSRCGDDRADGATPATAIASLKQLESFTSRRATVYLHRIDPSTTNTFAGFSVCAEK